MTALEPTYLATFAHPDIEKASPDPLVKSVSNSDWIARPMPFSTKKHGDRALIYDNDSVLERKDAHKYDDGCLAYTARPLPLGCVWNLTLTIDRVWGRTLRFGVTTSLPTKRIPQWPPLIKTSPDMWNYVGRSLYNNGSDTEFPDLPFLRELLTGQTVGLLITTHGDLHLYIDGCDVKKIASGLPVDKPLWGAVDALGKCTKVKSDILSVKRSHQHFDDEFPGVSLLGKPVEFTVKPEQKPVTISPPGHGVSLKIPQDAVQPDKPVNVTFNTCLSGPFKYPEGYSPLSSVHHISTDVPFENDVEVSIEHFANIETKEQAEDMTLFIAQPSNGTEEIQFVPMEGGKFEVGKESCTLSTQQVGFLSAGTKLSSEIRKRYTVLCSYSNEINDVRHAAIAVCVENAAYITNFRNALQEEWKVSISHRSELNVSFEESSACVEYPSDLKGWNIIPDSAECVFLEEDVDYSNPDALSMYDYPPRFIFEMTPLENAEPCTLQLGLTGMKKQIGFQVSLRDIKHTVISGKPKGLCERPDMLTLEHLTTSTGKVINIIEESANAYREIGTKLLNDRRGVRVDTIKSDENNKLNQIMRRIYQQWIAEDEHYSWTTLTECLRDCSLNTLASIIEEHFGIPPPVHIKEDRSLPDIGAEPQHQPPKFWQLLLKIGIPSFAAILVIFFYRFRTGKS